MKSLSHFLVLPVGDTDFFFFYFDVGQKERAVKARSQLASAKR
jgi:hypothetical protein